EVLTGEAEQHLTKNRHGRPQVQPQHVIAHRNDVVGRRVPIILKSEQHDSVSLVDNTQRRLRDGDALAEIEGTIAAGELDLLALLINRGLQQHLKGVGGQHDRRVLTDRKSTRLNSSHVSISYAVFCLKKKR